MEQIQYPVIINKYIALKQLGSRKEADRLLKAKKIWINGKLAEPGQMVNEKDKVAIEKTEDYHYVLFNKPEGVITHSPQVGEEEVADFVRTKIKLAPIGRLDKDSSGLILLTNDGRVTERLLHPDFWHEKEYEVGVNKVITPYIVKALANGVTLDDGYRTRKCVVRQIDERKLIIVLTEGKKRQIRRMLEALGLRVRELHRVRIMNLRIGDLREGEWRELSQAETREFLRILKLT